MRCTCGEEDSGRAAGLLCLLPRATGQHEPCCRSLTTQEGLTCRHIPLQLFGSIRETSPECPLFPNHPPLPSFPWDSWPLWFGPGLCLQSLETSVSEHSQCSGVMTPGPEQCSVPQAVRGCGTESTGQPFRLTEPRAVPARGRSTCLWLISRFLTQPT